jgi:2-dehydro-3-deoxygalactonokinase
MRSMIGVDWGPNLFRAWRIGADGAIRDRRFGTRGLLTVPDFRFADALREELGRWIAGGEDRVLICGPVAGSPGWRTGQTMPCPSPCGAAELAAGLTDVPFDWAQVKLVPGIRHADAETGVSTTLSGEETWLIGAAAAIGGTGLLCMPGPVTCWARLDAGRVTALTTYPSGEMFSALRAPMLGRAARDAPLYGPGFDRGVALAAGPGGLLRHIAELRAEAGSPDAAACLFGLLVGHELRAALTTQEEVHMVGPNDHVVLYARAIGARAGTALAPVADAAAIGLALIGGLAAWSSPPIAHAPMV